MAQSLRDPIFVTLGKNGSVARREHRSLASCRRRVPPAHRPRVTVQRRSLSKMTGTNVPTTKESRRLSGPSITCLIPFEQVNDPGTYVCNWNGHLLRVPSEGITSAGFPVINMVGPEPLFVTKIADDPYLTLSQARLLACNYDINVNF
jgi:hypothetical protein